MLTAEHAPLFWRYDLDPETNPHLMERLGINAVFNPGAMAFDGKYLLMARVEGADRKSFFAVAESANGVDGFRFWDRPVVMPQTDDPDVNVYDMRLVEHEDGQIYGLFCTERKDPDAPAGDLSSAIAQCGIARTRDLMSWERLADLETRSPQQRNVVLHPEFVDGKYAFYTRPQDGFIEAGSGGGIGWGLSDSIERAVIDEEIIVHDRKYHTIMEGKNGLGPAPIRTDRGLAAAGSRGARYRLGFALRALCLHDRAGRTLASDPRARWLPVVAPGARVHRRCHERHVLERLDRRRVRRALPLLRLQRHPLPRGDDDCGAAGGLLPEHAARSAVHGGLCRRSGSS